MVHCNKVDKIGIHCILLFCSGVHLLGHAQALLLLFSTGAYSWKVVLMFFLNMVFLCFSVFFFSPNNRTRTVIFGTLKFISDLSVSSDHIQSFHCPQTFDEPVTNLFYLFFSILSCQFSQFFCAIPYQL